MLAELLSTAPGLLIAVGLLVAALIFLAPIFMADPADWKSSERLVLVTDWGLSAAAVAVGLGILLIEMHGPLIGPRGFRNRFVISGFCFAFAGNRAYRSVRG